MASDTEGGNPSTTATRICPVALIGQVNNVYYWDAVDCNVGGHFSMTSTALLQTGCQQGNPDCIMNLAVLAPTSGARPTHYFAGPTDLSRDGLHAPLPAGAAIEPGPGAALVRTIDGRFSSGGPERAVRLFLLEAPLLDGRSGAPGRRTPHRAGFGQELDRPPGDADLRLEVYAHTPGEAYYVLRRGSEEDGELYHVLTKGG